MAIRISKNEDRQTGSVILLVEGALRLEDAQLLENICEDLSADLINRPGIDLAGITFLDSDSASVLIRLRQSGIALQGLDYFASRMIETAENEE